MTAPAGTANLAVKHFRDMLGACPECRDWMGEPDAANALERIYYDGLPLPVDRRHYARGELETYRPFVIANIAPSQGFSRTKTSMDAFSETGILEVKLQQTAPESLENDPSSDANVQWLNSIGQIIDGLCDLEVDAAAGHLIFNRIELVEWWWSNPKDAIKYGMFQGAKLRVLF